jgi:hypothetical protein
MHRMNGTRKSLGWGGVLLMGLLFALPAAAAGQAQGDRCKADCATKASEPLQSCVNTCPRPANNKDMKSVRTYQGCAARCSAHFKERLKTCEKKCPDTQKKK